MAAGAGGRGGGGRVAGVPDALGGDEPAGGRAGDVPDAGTVRGVRDGGDDASLASGVAAGILSLVRRARGRAEQGRLGQNRIVHFFLPRGVRRIFLFLCFLGQNLKSQLI